MLGTYFYHETIRKLVVCFGNLFNAISIDRLDDNGSTVQRIKVPIHYAPKEKYLVTITQPKTGVEIRLPLMSFEIADMAYNGDRKRNTLNKHLYTVSEGSQIMYTYESVPYDINFTLTLFARHTSDGMQIIEQIVPYFTPSFNMPIITIPSINIVEDVELTLNSISPAEEYEAGQDPEQKKFIWTFDFTMKANFYGPITQGKIITTAITQLYSNTDTSLVEAPNSNNLSGSETIEIPKGREIVYYV